jgi:uncharacterized membrane protein (UPF0127 family)
MALALINGRNRDIVATQVEVARTRRARRQGLLGRNTLPAHTAMMLSPCMAVHTAFMGFPIDVAFLDRDGRAVQLVHDLAPWRVAVSVRAHAVIELAAGQLQAHGVEVGDRLYLTPKAQA